MNKVSLHFTINENGIPQYSVSFNGKPVIKPSRLGFIINDSIHIDSNFQIIKVDSLTVDETWKPVWGEVAQIRNHYKQITFHLQQQNTSNLLMNIVFTVFEDGVGFRYEFPLQPNVKYFTVTDEETQFNLTGDHKTFWIPGDYDSNEYPYTISKISEVDAWKLSILSFGKRADNAPDEYAVQTPMMMKTADGLYINIHEAECFCIGSPPEHETIMLFTRLMGGPMDYTPGIFKLKNYAKDTPDRQMHSTLAKQLALYVTMYGPLQMAADIPDNYEAHMDAFQFIKDVPVDWDDTKIVEAEPGDYITIARKEKGKDA